ncbi:baeRF7 domain-containing protein [Mucilaginibacter phyllosphaerae]|uniref:baeRF7 domain-containing protein n=1 Tax=Mucilaginibacter phyllosphaerae TaxID=1812349 RepID=UPI0013049E78
MVRAVQTAQIFHGHGEGQGDDKDNIGIYCQEVDRTLLAEVLHDKTSPLILPG